MNPITLAACPNCRRELRVPREYLDRLVSCIHCDHAFHVRPSAELPARPDPPPPPAVDPTAGLQHLREAQQELAGQRAKVQELQAELEAERDQHRRAVRPTEPMRQGEPIDKQLESLRAERDRLQIRLTEAEQFLVETATRYEADHTNLAREFSEARAAWEARIRGLKADWDRERAELQAELRQARADQSPPPGPSDAAAADDLALDQRSSSDSDPSDGS